MGRKSTRSLSSIPITSHAQTGSASVSSLLANMLRESDPNDAEGADKTAVNANQPKRDAAAKLSIALNIDVRKEDKEAADRGSHLENDSAASASNELDVHKNATLGDVVVAAKDRSPSDTANTRQESADTDGPKSSTISQLKSSPLLLQLKTGGDDAQDGTSGKSKQTDALKSKSSGAFGGGVGASSGAGSAGGSDGSGNEGVRTANKHGSESGLKNLETKPQSTDEKPKSTSKQIKGFIARKELANANGGGGGGGGIDISPPTKDHASSEASEANPSKVTMTDVCCAVKDRLDLKILKIWYTQHRSFCESVTSSEDGCASRPTPGPGSQWIRYQVQPGDDFKDLTTR